MKQNKTKQNHKAVIFSKIRKKLKPYCKKQVLYLFSHLQLIYSKFRSICQMMQWFLWCFILFTVKADMKDTYFCFIKRGKCRHVCNSVEKAVGFCTKLNGNCCMWVPAMKTIIPEDQSTVSIKIRNKQNRVNSPSYTVHVVPFILSKEA